MSIPGLEPRQPWVKDLLHETLKGLLRTDLTLSAFIIFDVYPGLEHSDNPGLKKTFYMKP
jgi:hypothetical protein